jgi:hypothetical protein
MIVNIARGCGPTGRLLEGLLRERGIGTQQDAVVCYGTGYRGNLPALNGNVGRFDKYQQFVELKRAGVRVPNFFTPQEAQRATTFPLFGRALMHREGKDIMPALQPEDVPLRVAAGSTFFTEYVPRTTEYRVWIYRRRHLSTYQKVMRHPEMYKHFGCSFRNGFAFELVKQLDLPTPAIEQAGAAVSALGLDFGAVDVLQGKDGLPYVLEVNTAPGVDGPRVSISALADKIMRWKELGFPRRNGDNG